MKIRNVLLGSLLAVTFAGCGGTYYERTPVDAIPEGPGMFTGPEGAITLNTERKSPSSPEEANEFRDFKEFQRWKASPDYAEFQEWRRWKTEQESKAK